MTRPRYTDDCRRVRDFLWREEQALTGNNLTVSLSDAKIGAKVGLPAAIVAKALTDLEALAMIKMAKSSRGRSITVYASRDDDSDAISARISGKSPPVLERVTPLARGPSRPAITSAPPAAPKPTAIAPAKKWPPALGMPPSIEMRHPNELRIDDSYQRSTDTGPSRALIERIARGWDWRMCLPLVVSRREDGFYVIDGQHRLAAAQLRGDIPFLPCCVATYASVGDEAAMFVAMNRARRAINRLDDFHAARAGGDQDAIAVAALIQSVGFTVSRRTGSGAWAPGEVAFTSAIRHVRQRHGEKMAREALQLLADAFPDQRLVAGSSVFTAVAAVLAAPPAGFSRDRLLRALCAFDMKGWATFLDQSRGGTDRAKHLKDMLMAAYDDAGRVMAA